MHWELWSWFWVSTGFYYILYCDLPPRFYEYSLGIGTASIFISATSNIFSDFRDAIPHGWMRHLFNFFCLCICSWPLRIIYPCIFGINTGSLISEMSEIEEVGYSMT
uniref:Uncharacterized protein n=1 Tax=Lepeophtheirus salmonis TaxID=72036 RepID=A0A0K2U5I6_LEPSM